MADSSGKSRDSLLPCLHLIFKAAYDAVMAKRILSKEQPWSSRVGWGWGRGRMLSWEPQEDSPWDKEWGKKSILPPGLDTGNWERLGYTMLRMVH